MQSYSPVVPVGQRGHVAFTVANAYPVVIVQARLNGTQVVGSVPASEQPVVIDLRDMEGLGFSMPRTPGPYALTIYARDSVGCDTATTANRTITVQ